MPLHSFKIGVGFAMSRRPIIIGLILFNATITLLRSQRLLLGPFMNQLDDVVLTNGYFQQDSTTAQTNSTPLGFFLFPHLKDVVLRH
jgi:hypothetical protein